MIAFLGTWDFIRPVLVLFGTVLCLTSDIVTSLSSKDLTTLVSCSLQAKRPCGSSAKFWGTSPRERLVRAFRLILTEPSIDFDQLIIYPNFIHVSYVSREKNRHSIMTGSGAGKYCALTREAAMGLT